MKKILIAIAAGCLISASVINYEVKQFTAEVQQVDGILIFTDSKPVKEYEHIGNVSTRVSYPSEYNNIRNKLVGKCKNSFSQANAVILHFNTFGKDEAECIRIK